MITLDSRTFTDPLLKCKMSLLIFFVRSCWAAGLLIVSSIFVQTLDPFIQYDILNNDIDSSEIIKNNNLQ